MIREERRRAVSSIYHIVEKPVFVGIRREVDRLFSPALLSTEALLNENVRSAGIT